MLQKITDRIYYMPNEEKHDRPALAVIRGDECCMVIDAGNSPRHARQFQEELKALDFPPVRYLAITHYHYDHTLGLSAWDGVTTIASQDTQYYIQRYVNHKYDEASLQLAVKTGLFTNGAIENIKEEIPDLDQFHPCNVKLAFHQGIHVDLGGISCELKKIISTHTNDSTVIDVPEEKTLFLGDCVYGHIKNGHNFMDQTLMYAMIQSIKNFDAEYYLCSHETLCTKEEMQQYFYQLHCNAVLANECTSLTDAKNQFEERYHRPITEDDIFFLKSFGLFDEEQ